MVGVERRFRGALKRVGEAFTVGGANKTGVWAAVSPSEAQAFTDRAVIDAYAKPQYWVFVAPDDATVAPAAVSWQGQSLTLRHVVTLRWRGSAFAKLWLVTP